VAIINQEPVVHFANTTLIFNGQGQTAKNMNFGQIKVEQPQKVPTRLRKSDQVR
jgi:hypothetical protein